MADIVNLGVEVDAHKANKELRDLEKRFENVGDAAQKGLGKVDKESSKAGKGVKRAGAEAKKAGGGFTALAGGLLDVADGFGLMEGRMGRLINRFRGLFRGIAGLTRLFTGLNSKSKEQAAAATAQSVANTGLAASSAAAAGGVGALGAAMSLLNPIMLAVIATIGVLVIALSRLAIGAGSALLALTGLYKAFRAGSKVAANFEDARLQLAFMMGDMDKAKKRMAELVDFSNVTPFSPADVIGANKLLYAAGGDVLATNENLKLIGSAAMIAERPLNEVTSTFSRLYASLRTGKPDGEALRRLMVEIPVLSQRAGTELRKLAAAGASQAEMWKIVTDDLGKYSDMLAAASLTWNGLISTVQGKWDYMLSEFAAPIQTSLKAVLIELSNLIDAMVPYAQSLGNAIGNAIKAAVGIAKTQGIDALLDYLALGFEVATMRWMYFMQTYGTATFNVLGKILKRVLKDAAKVFATSLVQETVNASKDLAKAMAGKLVPQTPTGEALAQQQDAPAVKFANWLRGGLGMDPIEMPKPQEQAELTGKAVADALNKLPFMEGTFSAEQFKPQGFLGQIQSEAERLQAESPFDTKLLAEKQAKFDKDTQFGMEIWKEKYPQLQEGFGLENLKPQTQDQGGADELGKKTKEQKTMVQQLREEWSDLEGQIDKIAAGAMQGLADALFDVITGAKDAKQAFIDLGRAVVKEILKVIAQLLVELAIRTLIKIISGGAPQPGAPSTPASGIPAGVAHTGGIVGQTATKSMPMDQRQSGSQRYHTGGLIRKYHTGGIVGSSASVPAGTLKNARRYHNGSGGSMSSSEVPAILEKGEMVLSRSQRRQMEEELSKDPQSANAPQQTQEVKIVNVIDPAEVQREIASNPGLILNVVSRNRRQFQQALRG